jgi:PKD repeat protein
MRLRLAAGRFDAAVAVFVCLLALVVGSWGLGAHPDAVAGSLAGLGTEELQSAISSLEKAKGPANGLPLTCDAVSSGVSSCGVRASTASNLGWSNITTRVVPLPSPRLTVMTWDASDDYVLLYGGAYFTSNGGQQVADTWSYVNGTWTNLTSLVAGGPPPTPIIPSMAYDPWTSEVILFGGESIANYNLSLTWTYHARIWTNITASVGIPPSPRIDATFLADAASHQMILFGGAYGASGGGSGSFHDDTWLFSGTTWSNISGAVGSSPPPLYAPRGAYDPAESGIVLLGTNFEGPPYFADTYLFAGGVWHNLTPTEAGGSPLLDFPAMGYVAATSSILAVASVQFASASGADVSYPVEWEFSAGNWTNVTQSGSFPDSGSGAAVATDPSGALLLFGGDSYLDFFTQWMYAYASAPSAVGVTATPSALDVGSSTNFSAVFSGGLSPFQTTLTFGDGGSVNGTPTASHAYALPGTYSVDFNVTDFVGQSATGTTTVTVNPAPSGAVIRVDPASPSVGTNVNFTSSVTGGTPPFTSIWSFGDGSTATTNMATHSFSTSGTFAVNVTVTDTDGRSANTSLALTVVASGSGATPTGGTVFYLVIAAAFILIVVAAVIVVMRRRKRSPPTPPAAPPGVSMTAPPPSAAWDESLSTPPEVGPIPPSPWPLRKRGPEGR